MPVMETLRLDSSEISIFSKLEEEVLTEIKQYIDEYLLTEKHQRGGNLEVKKFLKNVKVEDALLMDYIKGRKHQVDIAWDTLRRYAENKFNFYPEMFPAEVPQKVIDLLVNNVMGVLKHKDKLGRRIVYFDMTKWDTELYDMDDLTVAAALAVERFWRLPEIVENGIIVVENTQGFGMAQAKQHTMQKLIRTRNIFLYSFPVAVKGIFYLQMPYVFALIFKMSKSVFPKKIRSRVSNLKEYVEQGSKLS